MKTRFAPFLLALSLVGVAVPTANALGTPDFAQSSQRGTVKVQPHEPGLTATQRAVKTDTASMYRAAGLVVPKHLRTKRDATARTTEVARPAATTANAEASAGATTGGPVLLPGLSRHVNQSCTGTGADGDRVQVMYVREADMADQYTDAAALIRYETQQIDDAMALSAAETGGGKRVRWVTNADCSINVLNVVLPDGAITGDLAKTETALTNAGYLKAHRKYLAFADVPAGGLGSCGAATLFHNDSATDNPNDGRFAQLARVDRNCWTTTDNTRSSVAMHEMLHTFGAVTKFAPHGSEAGHCSDEGDAMCYDDTGTGTQQLCPASHEPLLDCNSDDYFHTNPPAGSYLATHWNVAKSTFLDTVAALPAPPSVTVTTDKAAPTTGDLVTFTANVAAGTTVNWSTDVPACATPASTTGTTFTILCESVATPTVTATASNSGLTVGYASKKVTYGQGAYPELAVAQPSSAPYGTPFNLTASVTNAKSPWNFTWNLNSTGCTTTSPLNQATIAVTCGSGMKGLTASFGIRAVRSTDQAVMSSTIGVPITDVAAPTVTLTGPTTAYPGRQAVFTVSTNATNPTYTWSSGNGWGTPSSTNTYVVNVPAGATSQQQDQVTVQVTANGKTTQARAYFTVVTPLTVGLTTPATATSGTGVSVAASPSRNTATVTWATSNTACKVTPTSATAGTLLCQTGYAGDLEVTAQATDGNEMATRTNVVRVSAPVTPTPTPTPTAPTPTPTAPSPTPTTPTPTAGTVKEATRVLLTNTTGYPTVFKAVLDSTVGPVAGQRITLQRRTSTTWSNVATATTTADGSASFSAAVTTAAYYRAVFAGTTGYSASNSAENRVTVYTKVSIAKTTRGLSGKLMNGAGKGLPSIYVVLQRKTSTGYTKVATYKTTSTGTLSVRINPSRLTYYRWAYGGNSTYRASNSGNVALR